MRTALARRAQAKFALMVLVAIGIIAAGSLVPWKPAQGQQPTTIMYTPAKEDYLPEYERDRANGKLQSWDQYWGWVKAFYAGNLVSDGWTRRGEQSLAAIKLSDNRQELIERYNDLGKLVSREWAKDYAVRKITSADLRRWHETVTESVRTDTGTGEKIKKALGKVREQAEKRLGAPSHAAAVAVRGKVADSGRYLNGLC